MCNEDYEVESDSILDSIEGCMYSIKKGAEPMESSRKRAPPPDKSGVSKKISPKESSQLRWAPP